jgi:hypothetical protein
MHAGEDVRRSGCEFFGQRLNVPSFTEVVKDVARGFAVLQNVFRSQRLVFMSALRK